MNVLVVHNQYQQPGGEDQVFEAETALLEEHGHRVARYEVHNNSVSAMSSVGLAAATLWNSSSYNDLRALMRRERPQIAHFHNTFPLISPAGYFAAQAEGVRVVQTLHNYRLLCPTASFYRAGGVCEDCLGKSVPWPGVMHACYRGSRSASGAVATMLVAHRALRTWTKQVNLYIALTDFARRKFIQGGLPAEKITVKPNFLNHAPELGKGRGRYALFVGRFAPEKGVDTLMAAWQRIGERLPLKVVGDGPMAELVALRARDIAGVELLGGQPRERVLQLMRNAQVMILPSVWYEGFPMVIVEAFAVGLPVIASDIGGLSSIVAHGRTGLHFRAGDPMDLVEKVLWASRHPDRMAQMRTEAKSTFERNFTAERNYEILMQAYEAAMV